MRGRVFVTGARRLGMAAVLLHLFLQPTAANAEERFSWPPLPDGSAIQNAMAMRTDSGLVILERRVKLFIRSLGAPPEGVRREEFIRFVIVNDEGVRKATTEIHGDPEGRILSLEGRTVSPDGTTTSLDAEHDVQRATVTTSRGKKSLGSLASVRFPAPSKGAVLDLRFSTASDNRIFFYAQNLAYGETPAMTTDIDVSLAGGLQGVPWSMLTLGDSQGAAKLTKTPAGMVNIHLGPYTPQKGERLEPPAYARGAFLLCYLNLLSLRRTSVPLGGFHGAYGVDSRGRIQDLVFADDPYTEYWVKYLKAQSSANRRFLDRAGAADDPDVAVEAPESFPLEERVARLYRLSQDLIRFNPDADTVDTLAGMMKQGMQHAWQGTLLLSRLLERARIPHTVGVVANRYSLRFAPAITNEYLYGFQNIVVVEPPRGSPLFLMPGEQGVPFGCLPNEYQDALVLLPEGKERIRALYTPIDPFDVDSMRYRYDVELDAAGAAAGKLTYAVSGAPAHIFRRENALREFRASHPAKSDDRNAAVREKARREVLERSLEDELQLPGARLRAEQRVLLSCPKRSAEPVQIGATIRGEGVAQPSQDKWLVYANPVLADFIDPFVEETRKTPIWYDRGGHVVVEGDIKLPPGAEVLELPAPSQFQTPHGVVARSEVTKVERDGAVFLHAAAQYDVWPVVGTDEYGVWRACQSYLARVAQERCIVVLLSAKQLE